MYPLRLRASRALFGTVLLAALSGLFPCPGRAGAPPPPPSVSKSSPAPKDSRLSLSLETAYVFQQVPNPFFGIAGLYNKNPLDYRLLTQIVSLRYRLTETGGPGPFRGNLEGSAGLLYSTILQGAETFYAGYVMGFRYTFVPKNFPLQPYVEVRGSIGWTDSRGFRFAQQQDLTFSYLLGAGVRYDVTPKWNVTLGALDQHLSNAYLTRPNYGFDSVGVQLGVGRKF